MFNVVQHNTHWSNDQTARLRQKTWRAINNNLRPVDFPTWKNERVSEEIGIGVGAQSTLGARHFCTKIYVWKINKIPEFYMIIAGKNCPDFWGARAPCPRLIRLWKLAANSLDTKTTGVVCRDRLFKQLFTGSVSFESSRVISYK